MFTPKSLIIRYARSCLLGLTMTALPAPFVKGDEHAPYAAWFNPAKGFKPAQPNFQMIFLQMAGSFEDSGSPEPYLRHVMAENARIDAKYQLATGKTGSSRPPYFTDEYLEKILRNWNRMAPVLALENLIRESGRNMRYAVMGGWNMSVSEICARQTGLTGDQTAAYRELLQKEWFTKADFPALEEFYKTTFDKLTEDGKNQISRRTWLGQSTPEKRKEAMSENKGGTMLLGILREHQKKSLARIEDKTAPMADSGTLRQELRERLQLDSESVVPDRLQATERDALFYSHAIVAGFQKRIDQVRRQAKQPGQGKVLEEYLVGMTGELLVAAQMEFQLGLNEGWTNRKRDPN